MTNRRTAGYVYMYRASPHQNTIPATESSSKHINQTREEDLIHSTHQMENSYDETMCKNRIERKDGRETKERLPKARMKSF